MRNRNIHIVCVLIGFIFSCCVTRVLIRANDLQNQVASQVLRFHVLANSDDAKDQELKMEVKEAVLTFMERSLQKSGDLEETKIWAKQHLPQIENVARTVIKKHGFDYSVRANVGESHFPNKTYGDITFPAGNYEALRIEIGEAEGQNWWCVIYPKLCFMDAVHGIVPEEGKDELKEVLEEEAYQMVTAKTKFRLKWFFF